ncbi:hypothetical protein DCAR_0624130 [Daucus carota subsp. sativus]|uniref:Uncharacterized protein n=1 Tax=Daucus carota subsp. sativus TaxID=79200 RepID=A0AAF1B4V4_DAUCS|nr:hypothetical protein DCAR_0624130 [Daucus carota subsp. sativus]
MIRPLEQMLLADHLVKGFISCLTMTIVSCMKVVRIAIGMEKGIMHPQKFRSSVECFQYDI